MTRRREIFAGILNVLAENAPSTLLYQQLQAFATRKNVVWQPYPHLFMDFRQSALRFETAAK